MAPVGQKTPVVDEATAYSTQTFEWNLHLALYDVQGNYTGYTNVDLIITASNNTVTKIEPKNAVDPAYINDLNRDIGKMMGREVYYRSTRCTAQKSGIQYVATQVSLGSLQPGDILYWDPWNGRAQHWAVYIGNGQSVHGGWDSQGSVVIAGTTSGVFPPERPAPTAWRMR
jgi:hypothetical protein